MNIFFSGIGGVGIGPLAEIAFDAGHSVQGSDLSESLTTKELAARGIPIFINNPASADMLAQTHSETPLDWFVYTAALPETHPELLWAKQQGIRVAKRDEFLAFIIKEHNLKLLAVAGTHGKTTTTSMLVWAFKQLGIPVSWSIGSQIPFGPSGKFDPNSEYFVYEADEFDRNFLHFQPHASIILNVDFDHPDVYKTQKEYDEAFAEFGAKSDFLVTWHDQKPELYATHANAWILQENDLNPRLTLGGLHNRKNAALVLKLCEFLHIPATPDHLNTFPGAVRRMEKIVKNLYSDYGHHPTEIAATLSNAKELNSNVVLVYQPHQNIRQHEIIDLYKGCFFDADKIFWLPTYLSREDPELEILAPAQLTAAIPDQSRIHIAELDRALAREISTSLAQGAIVVAMGAGSIDAWIRETFQQS